MSDIENWNILGTFVRIVSDGTSCGGGDLLDAIVPPGGGTPRHVHSLESECFYVIEGTLTFDVGGKVVHAHAGTLVQGPPGVPHAFRNETATPARIISTSFPGQRHANFLRELGERLPQSATSASPVEYTQDLASKIARVSEKYGIRVLGE
ncbi:cupin domain-containing protein [Methylobacterium oryzisoli]|uniref:cupin domain-containing protein n=1 Tax=Methylobacterium oryzisoli TaxID=3385502 RepID=UPI0038915BDC